MRKQLRFNLTPHFFCCVPFASLPPPLLFFNGVTKTLGPVYRTPCTFRWMCARFADSRRATASQRQAGNYYSGGRRIRRIEDACFPVYNAGRRSLERESTRLHSTRLDSTRFDSTRRDSRLHRAGRADIESSIQFIRS